MSRFPGIRRLFRIAPTARAVQGEVDDELHFHLDSRTEALTRGGMTADEARRVALKEFGDLHAARTELASMGQRRQERTARAEWWQEMRQDLRYAARALVRQRAFSLAVVLTLALGIGANSTIFTVVNATWFRWRGAFHEPDRLMVVFQSFAEGRGMTSPADFHDWRAQSRSFDAMAAYHYQSVTLIAGGEPERLLSAAVSPAMFGLVGVRPLLGRDFRPGEETWGDHRVALLSQGLWQRRFGGDSAVIGSVVSLNGDAYHIVGVLPAGAWFDDTPADVFTPMAFAPNDPINDRHSHFLWVVARLKAGVSFEQASSDMRGIAGRIATMYRENQGTSAVIEPLPDVLLGGLRPTLRLLIGAVLLVLLIACANVANLLLVRGAARERELAIRTALGAGRARIARQLLTESMVLAAIGGVAGIALATWGVRIAAQRLPAQLPRVHETGLSIDWRVLSASLGLTLLTGVLCGLLPALQLPGRAVVGAAGRVDSLRDGGRGTAGGTRGRRVRQSLVVVEVAIALVLLTGAGLLIRSLLRLQHVETGVRADPVLTMRITPSRARAAEPARMVALYDDIIARAEAVPGVRAAGVTSHLPLNGGGESKHFWVEGHTPAATLSAVPTVSGRMESARSLPAMGATLLAGRFFTDRDDEKSPNVVLISEEVARRFFRGEDPIGKRVSLHPPEHLWPANDLRPGERFPRWTVIGVVKDVKYTGLRDGAEPVVWVPYPQGKMHWNWGPQWLVVQSAGDPHALASPIRRALRAADATLPLTDVMTLRERMSFVMRGPRFTTSLMSLFAAAALLLGSIGLYGVIAYAVSQETRAIGIRLALGARGGDILRLVLGRGLILVAMGIGIGLVVAMLLARTLASHLFGVGAMDPLTYGGVALLLAVVAMIASYLPARRATRVDPVVALRMD